MGSAEKKLFCTESPVKDRTLLASLFLASLVIICWGRIEIELAPSLSLSVGGTSRALIFGLFALYVLLRVRKRDMEHLSFVTDPLALFAMICLLSVIPGKPMDFSLAATRCIPALLAYFMLRYLIARSCWEDYLAYIRIIPLCAVLIVVRAFADVKSNFFIDPTIMSTSSEHHTLVAMMIMAALPFALALLLTDRKRAWLYAVYLVVMVVGMILANSRIGWVALGVVLLYLMLSVRDRRSRYVLCTLSALLLLSFLFLFPHLHTRFLTLFNLMADSDFTARLEIWRCSLLMIGNHPLWGIGFSDILFTAQGAALREGFAWQHPHNLFLAVPVYTGIPGTVVFLWIMASIARSLVIIAGSSRKEVVILAHAFTASFLSLLVCNMADTVFAGARPALLAFLLMGLLFELASREARIPVWPVRIYYFIGTLGRGGAEGQVIALIERLDRTKFSPLLVVLKREGDWYHYCHQKRIPLFILDFKGVLSTFYPWNLALLLKNASVLLLKMYKEKPVIVHGYLFVSYAAAALFGKLATVPVIITSRRSLGTSKTRTWTWCHRIIEMVVNGWTDVIIANSEAVRNDTLEREGLSPGRVTCIYNGVEIRDAVEGDDPLSLRKALGIPGNARLVGMLANLIGYKNQAMMIRALPLIREHVPHVHVVFIGRDGGMKEDLQRQAVEEGVDDAVTFSGARQDVPDILTLLEVSVLTSREEGFPNALLESMAAGVPVVATRVGGIPEVVEEEVTAFLVEPDDYRALATNTVILLEDRNKAREMGARGRERVMSLFTMERMVKNTEALYVSLLSD